jgi:hypothetical protein
MEAASGSRFLITGAVTQYPRRPDLDRPELTDDVARIVGLFGRDFGYTHLPLPGSSPTFAQLRDGLRNFSKAPDRHPDDFVAVYLACHGAVVEPDDFVLLPSDIDPEDPLPLAVTPHDLVGWLLCDTNIQRLLLMIDACHPGHGGREAAQTAARWVHQPGFTDRAGIVLVTATHPRQKRSQVSSPGLLSGPWPTLLLADTRRKTCLWMQSLASSTPITPCRLARLWPAISLAWPVGRPRSCPTSGTGRR